MQNYQKTVNISKHNFSKFNIAFLQKLGRSRYPDKISSTCSFKWTLYLKIGGLVFQQMLPKKQMLLNFKNQTFSKAKLIFDSAEKQAGIFYTITFYHQQTRAKPVV